MFSEDVPQTDGRRYVIKSPAKERPIQVLHVVTPPGQQISIPVPKILSQLPEVKVEVKAEKAAATLTETQRGKLELQLKTFETFENVNYSVENKPEE